MSFVIYKELIFNFDVITNSGDIIVGRRNGNGKDGLATPNPTLIGGKDPEGKEEHLDKAQELQESFPWVDIIN